MDGFLAGEKEVHLKLEEPCKPSGSAFNVSFGTRDDSAHSISA